MYSFKSKNTFNLYHLYRKIQAPKLKENQVPEVFTMKKTKKETLTEDLPHQRNQNWRPSLHSSPGFQCGVRPSRGRFQKQATNQP